MAIKITNTVPEKVFHTKCTYCLTEFDYEGEDLGFRAWYPHGFVYCPRCGKPIRHHPENNLKKD